MTTDHAESSPGTPVSGTKTGKARGGTLDWIRSAGPKATVAWTIFRIKKLLGLRQPAELKIKPRQLKFPVAARLGGTSDLGVLFQIFVFEEYACMRDVEPPRLILDLGANVGYASAYFLSCFPNARVVAVEPDPNNFAMCCKNLAPYGSRAQVILGAVWSRRSKLSLSRGTFGDGLDWAIQVHEPESTDASATVDAWDVPSLLQLAGGDYIDFLKVDIEGSEVELFGKNSSEWLPKVGNICVELHGAECEKIFLGALQDFEYDLSTSTELTIARHLRPRAPQMQ
jgi:FkbM family methyltransferase